jgi:hypothetical protein
VNAIPDPFAQWDAAYVLRRAVSCRASGVPRLVLLPNPSPTPD